MFRKTVEEFNNVPTSEDTASNESYTYDMVGNRLTSADVQGNWSYNESNELLSYNDVSYEYDSNGNIIGKTDQTGTTTFTYDQDNRLVQLITPNSQLITYYYDPFGKRLWKDVNGVRNNFLYSDEGLVGEYDSSGNEIKSYGYAPDSTWTTNPVFQKIGTNYYWYQNDHLGTPQKITDSTGRVVWSATFDSFGKGQIQVSEIENNLRFPGQYYDQETGMLYVWNRYYDPRAGRYLSTDPIGLEAGINLYVYAGNDPENSIDPDGLSSERRPKRDWGIGWGIGFEGHFIGGIGFDSYFCCDVEGRKWRIRTIKQCKGLALNVPWRKLKEFSPAITGGIQFSYLKGKDCPSGFEGAEYTEIGYGPIEVGIPRPNPILDPGKGGSWSGTTIGFGVGGGFKYTKCKYKVWDKAVVGCCSL